MSDFMGKEGVLNSLEYFISVVTDFIEFECYKDAEYCKYEMPDMRRDIAYLRKQARKYLLEK